MVLMFLNGGAMRGGALHEALRDCLLSAEPDELELGIIELQDGSRTLSMIRRRTYSEPVGAYRDISAHAGWRTYQDSVKASP